MSQTTQPNEASPELKLWRSAIWGGLLLFVPGVILFSISCFVQNSVDFESFFPPGCLLMAFGGLGLAYAGQVERPNS